MRASVSTQILGAEGVFSSGREVIDPTDLENTPSHIPTFSGPGSHGKDTSALAAVGRKAAGGHGDHGLPSAGCRAALAHRPPDSRVVSAGSNRAAHSLPCVQARWRKCHEAPNGSAPARLAGTRRRFNHERFQSVRCPGSFLQTRRAWRERWRCRTDGRVRVQENW